MKNSLMAAGVASFAHLLGGRRTTAKKAEEEKRKDEKFKRAEDEEDTDKEASEDDDKEEAEDDFDDAKAEDDEHCEDDDKEKDGKKAKTYSAGRREERARCAAIFASPAAAGQPHVAAKLAFTTDLTAKQAIGVLAETASSEPQGSKRGLGDRMATVPNPTPGADGGSAPEKGNAAETVARMTAVYDRVSGKK